MKTFVGQAGWSIPKEFAEAFPNTGTHLQRFAQRLTGVEINSTFYRSHRPATFARWAESVPAGFKFALKAPRTITHQQRLYDVEGLLEAFLVETASLGEKRGPLLFQLPPSLRLEPGVVQAFLGHLRRRYTGDVVFEPRHPSWFLGEGDALLAAFQVARAAADPAVVPEAEVPGAFPGLVYYRWHGSPRKYYSAYAPEVIDALATAATRHPDAAEVWFMFDNTTIGAATGNALELQARLRRSP